MPLDAAPGEPPADWTVAEGPQARVDDPPPGRLIGELTLGELQYWAAAQGEGERRWLLRHRETAETELDLDRRAIEIRLDPHAPEGFVPLLLAGSVLAHVLAAEGHSALHASAVESGGRAVAFIGPSGRGKSTLAALLCSAGASLVSDDLLRCEVTGGGATCFRGSSRLRLRPQAAALAASLPGAAVETADGRTALVPRTPGMRRMPLAALVVPRPSREAEALAIRRLRGREAAAEILRSPRLLGWTDPELATRHLDLCRDLAGAVPVLEATIPWGPPFAEGLADELLGRVLSDA